MSCALLVLGQVVLVHRVASRLASAHDHRTIISPILFARDDENLGLLLLCVNRAGSVQRGHHVARYGRIEQDHGAWHDREGGRHLWSGHVWNGRHERGRALDDGQSADDGTHDSLQKRPDVRRGVRWEGRPHLFYVHVHEGLQLVIQRGHFTVGILLSLECPLFFHTLLPSLTSREGLIGIAEASAYSYVAAHAMYVRKGSSASTLHADFFLLWQRGLHFSCI